MACGDGNVDIADGVARTDLRTFRIESDSERTTFLCLLCCASIVNHTLVVLFRQHVPLSQRNWRQYFIRPMTKVHSNNIHASFPKFVDHFHTVGLGT